jgi:hypothetical protein
MFIVCIYRRQPDKSYQLASYVGGSGTVTEENLATEFAYEDAALLRDGLLGAAEEHSIDGIAVDLLPSPSGLKNLLQYFVHGPSFRIR